MIEQLYRQFVAGVDDDEHPRRLDGDGGDEMVWRYGPTRNRLRRLHRAATRPSGHPSSLRRRPSGETDGAEPHH